MQQNDTKEMFVLVSESADISSGDDYTHVGMPAVFSMTEAMNNPKDSAQKIEEQLEKMDAIFENKNNLEALLNSFFQRT